MQIAGKTNFGPLYWRFHSFVWVTAVIADDPDVLIRVSDSFDALATLPDWYQYLLFLAVSASFGIRGADKLMKLRGK